MKPTLLMVAALLGAALLVSGCAGGPKAASTPAPTPAASPVVPASDVNQLGADLTNATTDLNPPSINFDDLGL